MYRKNALRIIISLVLSIVVFQLGKPADSDSLKIMLRGLINQAMSFA